jgi:hypothetical protein
MGMSDPITISEEAIAAALKINWQEDTAPNATEYYVQQRKNEKDRNLVQSAPANSRPNSRCCKARL